MTLPLISMELIDAALQLLKDNIPSTDRKYYRFMNYLENEYMTCTTVDLWHHGCADCNNFVVLPYNYSPLFHKHTFLLYHLREESEREKGGYTIYH
jgi:hypothetical protein